jgi:hypothetical protein
MAPAKPIRNTPSPCQDNIRYQVEKKMAPLATCRLAMGCEIGLKGNALIAVACLKREQALLYERGKMKCESCSAFAHLTSLLYWLAKCLQSSLTVVNVIRSYRRVSVMMASFRMTKQCRHHRRSESVLDSQVSKRTNWCLMVDNKFEWQITFSNGE